MSNLQQFHGGLLKYNTGQIVTATNAAEGVQSNAFASDTVAVLVGSYTNGASAHFAIGADPIAGNGQPIMSSLGTATTGAGGGSYTGPLGCNGGDRLACQRTSSVNATVSIIELKY